MHRLLRRQLQRFFGSDGPPEEMQEFLQAVSDAYATADDDRRQVERSLELMSTELLERNDALRHDIAERKRVEEELLASQERQAAMLFALPDMVITIGPEGTIEGVHAPDGSYSMNADKSWVGQKISEVFPESAAEQLLSCAKRARSGGDASTEFELVEGDGLRTYETRLGASPEGLVVAVVRDVTSQRKMADQLLTANRMASVGMLAAGVAHEINNPLTFVLGNLEFLDVEIRSLWRRSGDAKLKELSDAIGEAFSGASRVRDIVRELKVFSRTDSRSEGPVEIQKVVESALAVASNQLRHTVEVVRDYQTVPKIRANESRIAQVVLNLIVNAAQAVSDSDIAEPQIRIGIRDDREGHIVIEISDNGPGISEEVLPRIFDPFFSTKPIGVGTGLGLSICHGIVSDLGGELGVETTPGEGTTFRVRLPGLSKVKALGANAPTSKREETVEARLLVIDDEPLVGATIGRLLAKCDVTFLDSGSEAVTRLGRGEAYDVVLCDLMMPEVTGMDVYAALEAMDPDLLENVVFMSGGCMTDKARKFLESVPNEVVQKPFDVPTLREIVLRRIDHPSRVAVHI